MWRVTVFPLLLPYFFAIVYSEYFTSSSHLKDLLLFEIQLQKQLKDYIKNEEFRIARLRNFYSRKTHIANYTNIQPSVNASYSELNSSVSDNYGELKWHVEKHIFIYRAVKRRRSDWMELKVLEHKKKDILHMLSKRTLPSDRDIRGAQDAILRLQGTFALSPRQIVNGIVRNSPRFTKLGATDAFDIGVAAFNKDIPNVSINWMFEALRLLDVRHMSADVNTLLRVDILDYMQQTKYTMDNFETFHNHTSDPLQLEIGTETNIAHPNITSTPIQLHQYIEDGESERIRKSRKEKKKERKKFPHFFYTLSEDVYTRRPLEIERARALCRGETDPIPLQYHKDMVCWYKHDHPLLTLKPAKVDRIYMNPELLIFRNAMSEREMTHLKQISASKLHRVHNPAINDINIVDYRISESAWISEADSWLYNSINNRIEAYTGLDMSTAEPLQVANYGMGGHYDPHFDFGNAVSLRPPPWKNRTDLTKRSTLNLPRRYKQNGERIATMLFYMSEVEIGGSTVFTNLGQAVKPSKGDALYWYNLNHDGSGDYQTRHAACPVLIGEKWVSNKWIHERGQEFRRRCKLRPEDD